jgi:hypothetical protein
VPFYMRQRRRNTNITNAREGENHKIIINRERTRKNTERGMNYGRCKHESE